MSFGVADDSLLVGEVSEVHGARLKVRIYADANEAHTFFRGEVVRGVSVGGYIKIPCGYDNVIGIIEGDYQQESRVIRETADSRVAPGQTIERFVDVSVFGVMSKDRFDRGISTLPLVKSKAYLLTADELGSINSPTLPDEPIFRVGTGTRRHLRIPPRKRAVRQSHRGLRQHRFGQVEYAMQGI